MIVTPGDDFITAWVLERLDVESLGPCTSLAVLSDEGALLGGIVFHQYDAINRTIQLSAASATPRWLSRSALRAIFSYPFDQLGCARITCLTGRKNREARQFLEKFGYRLEGVIRKGLRGQDLMLYGLLKSEWQKGRFSGEKVLSSSAYAGRSGCAGERASEREHTDGARAAAA